MNSIASTSAPGGFMLQTMLYLVNHNATNTFMNSVYNYPTEEQTADANDIKCFGVYGCFPITYPWTDESRPNNVYPFSPQRLDVRYPVFTNKHRDIPKFIDINDPDSVQKIGIHPKGHIYFIAHGFLESGDRPWIRNMTNALLDIDKHGQSTVVVVDWRAGSSPPYTQAVANIRLIGAITAHVIHLIYEEVHLPNLDKVHMIGHSLGSHLSGYAGYTLQNDFGLTVGRISALDPAEPLFGNTDAVVRLDQSDAKFVDVVHSDITSFVKGGFGMRQNIGHVDFYPNGGYDQPGCNQQVESFMENENSFFRGFQKLVGCNHVRSIALYTESILSKCPYLSITCDSYEDFKNGKCFNCNREGHYCVKFGFHSQQSYRSLFHKGYYSSDSLSTYLMTSSSSPYCKAHYKIMVKVSSSEDSLRHGGEMGTLWFKMRGNDSLSEKIPFSTEPVFFEPGKNFTFMTVGENVGHVMNATMSYTFKSNPLNPFTWRIFTPKVFVDYVIIESMENNSKIKLCPSHDMPVVQNENIVFREESCAYRKH